jgi:hypothetical protein
MGHGHTVHLGRRRGRHRHPSGRPRVHGDRQPGTAGRPGVVPRHRTRARRAHRVGAGAGTHRRCRGRGDRQLRCRPRARTGRPRLARHRGRPARPQGPARQGQVRRVGLRGGSSGGAGGHGHDDPQVPRRADRSGPRAVRRPPRRREGADADSQPAAQPCADLAPAAARAARHDGVDGPHPPLLEAAARRRRRPHERRQARAAVARSPLAAPHRGDHRPADPARRTGRRDGAVAVRDVRRGHRQRRATAHHRRRQP